MSLAAVFGDRGSRFPGCAGSPTVRDRNRGVAAPRRPGFARRAVHAGILSLLASAALSGSALAATTLEVELEGGFVPLDRAVVPTPRASIRILLDSGAGLVSVTLVRDDGRAGLDGQGKDFPVCAGPGESDCVLDVGLDAYEGLLETLVGRNTLVVETDAPETISATFLTYGDAYEDLNGNGVLDTDEDDDGDGVLDPGEDDNGNGLLDGDEDRNGNGRLDVSEDLDGDGELDPGEDLDGDGTIGPLSAGVAADLPADAADYQVFPDSDVAYSRHGVALAFVTGAGDAEIGALLRGAALRPAGVIVDDTVGGKRKVVTAQVEAGVDPLEVVQALNGVPVGGPEILPGDDARPVSPPLDLALPLIREELAEVFGESLPSRLILGAPAPPGSGNVGDAYDPNTGGFDNRNEDPVNDFDELDIAWPHFYVQSYPALRLAEGLVAAATANPVRPRLAVIDSGFGDGGAVPPDLQGRLVRATDCDAGGCRPVGLGGVVDTRDHGTAVATMAAGRGDRVLGLGRAADVRVFRVGRPDSVALALLDAARDPSVDVINLSRQLPNFDRDDDGVLSDTAGASGFSELELARIVLTGRSLQFGPALRELVRIGSGKLVVLAAGNHALDTGFSLAAGPAVIGGESVPGLFDAPIRGSRREIEPNGGILAVGATAVGIPPSSFEMRAPFSNRGSRIGVTAPGQDIVSLRPDGTLNKYDGTSFAAPQVAGLAALLMFLDENTRASPFGPAQIAELIEATADDLGGTPSPLLLVNDRPGDGPEDAFGFGRVNAWKAVLSVANGGLAEQAGRDAASTPFVNLPVVDDVSTEWYGFEVVTHERQATAWIDGVELRDAGLNGADGAPGTADDLVPFAPRITAYQGSRGFRLSSRGVHTESDGSSPDLGREIAEDDGLVDIVPTGAGTSGRGLFVLRFSIRKADMVDGQGLPRTLSIRPRDALGFEKPLFNLRLNTAEMRTGRVSGVVFDDFVFQVVSPDFGDAPAPYPTALADLGARHHNTALEWLGRLGGGPADSVSAEHNARFEPTGGDVRVDVDGVPNTSDGSFQDRDGRDDGVLFFPLTYRKPGDPGKVRFTVGVADPTSPRYSPAPDRNLYFNLWIDWNGNGRWEETNDEHVLDGVQIDPGSPWNLVSQGASGTTQIVASAMDGTATTFESTIPVGNFGEGHVWARARLDYGENVGRNDPRPIFRSFPSLRDPALAEDVPHPAGAISGYTYGAARYGEVEDYFVGADFGDAADVSCAEMEPPQPNTYPTCRANLGAHHLDFHREWLGLAHEGGPGATREAGAADRRPPGSDQDGTPNLEKEQNDELDNGVILPPLIPGTRVEVVLLANTSIGELGGSTEPPGGAIPGVSVPEDEGDSLPRYGAGRLLYISGWADWNGDGVWSAADGEKIIDDVQDPLTWGTDGQYTLGETFDDRNSNGVYDEGDTHQEAFGKSALVLAYEVDVPDPIAPRFSLRFRLAYGEDDGETIDIPIRTADADGRLHQEDRGGALFGEVEDYVWEDEPRPYDGTTGLIDLWLPPDEEPRRVPVTGVIAYLLKPDIDDFDGDGREERRAEIGRLEMTGEHPVLGSFILRLRSAFRDPFLRSTGTVEELVNVHPGVLDAPPDVTDPPDQCVEAQIDLYVEVETGSGERYHNVDPAEAFGTFCGGAFPGLDEFLLLDTDVDLVDEDGQPVEGSLGPLALVPDPSGDEPDFRFFTDFLRVLEIRIPEDAEPHPVALRGSMVLAADLRNVGDPDGDGLESIDLEIISLRASGFTDRLGEVLARLRPRSLPPGRRSMGTLEERVNNVPGTLEVFPLVGDMTATGDFTAEEYVQIRVGGPTGTVLYNRDALTLAVAAAFYGFGPGRRMDGNVLVKAFLDQLLPEERTPELGGRIGFGYLIPEPLELEVLEAGFTVEKLPPGVGPRGLACGPGGVWGDDIHLADSGGGRIERIDEDGNPALFVAGRGFPVGLVFGSSTARGAGPDRMVVGESSANQVVALAPDGTELQVSPVPSAAGVAIATGGAYGDATYAATYFTGPIHTVDAAGNVGVFSTVASSYLEFGPGGAWGDGLYSTHHGGDFTIDIDIPIGAPIPDVGALEIPVTLPDSFLIDDLDVTVDLPHSDLGDLTITLTGPDGTSVELWSGQCDGHADLLNRFDDDGTAAACNPTGSTPAPGDGNGRMPPRGTGRLADFDGSDLQGNWTLVVTDGRAGAAGSLTSWTLHVGQRNSGLARVQPDGSFDLFSRGMVEPGGFDWAWDGDLFATDRGAGEIVRVAPDGTRVSWARGPGVIDAAFCDCRLHVVSADGGAWRVHGSGDDADGDGTPEPCDSCAGVANPGQGATTFDTIRAVDRDTFGWQTVVDFIGVRGDLDGVAGLPVDVQFSGSDSVWSDASTPGAGAGFYYLFRHDCDAGSWQTADGAEPGRDPSLP